MTGNLHENLHDFHCDSPLFIGNKMFATKAVETNKIIICCQAHLLPKSYGSRDKTNANERTTVVTYCLDICSTLLAGLSGCIATLHLDALPLCVWVHCHSASGCIATLHLGALPLCIPSCNTHLHITFKITYFVQKWPAELATFLACIAAVPALCLRLWYTSLYVSRPCYLSEGKSNKMAGAASWHILLSSL